MGCATELLAAHQVRTISRIGKPTQVGGVGGEPVCSFCQEEVKMTCFVAVRPRSRPPGSRGHFVRRRSQSEPERQRH